MKIAGSSLLWKAHWAIKPTRQWDAVPERAFIASVYDWKVADGQPDGRSDARVLTHPINKPRGIDPSIVQEHARGVNNRQDTVKPDRRDIRPEDVFAGTPDQMGVRNFAETGRDLQRALDSLPRKDKGYEVVKNLSQYLIRTEGGGDGKPAGKKL